MVLGKSSGQSSKHRQSKDGVSKGTAARKYGVINMGSLPIYRGDKLQRKHPECHDEKIYTNKEIEGTNLQKQAGIQEVGFCTHIISVWHKNAKETNNHKTHK